MLGPPMRSWSLSDLALSRPVTVGMLLVAIVLLGTIAAFRLPLAFLPTDDRPRAYVRVFITSTSPQVLEREVIRPIEEQLAGLRDLHRIQVASGTWGARMNLEFTPGTDADARKLELRDRMERVRPELPDIVQRFEIGSYSINDDPIMELQLASDLDLTKNYYLIQRRLVRPLERIKGVSRVELDGLAPHELEIAVELDAAKRAGVDVVDIGTAVRDARRGRSLGAVRSSNTNVGVRNPAQDATAEAFAALPIPRSAASALPADTLDAQETTGLRAPRTSMPSARLDEAAHVSVHPEDRREGHSLNGRPAINLQIYGAAGASIVEVNENIRSVLASVGNDSLLQGIEIITIYDQGQMIVETLGDLRNTGIWGGLLGILVLFAFLHRIRTTLAAAVSIPLSVLAACAVLFLQGQELNCIVLLGLVLGVGMLIDNAVVIVESIARQARRGRDPMTAARLGAREVGLATMASTLSSVIVFLALILGDEGDAMTAMLRPLGTTFAIALVSSLVVSQLAVPLLMGRILKPSPRPVRHAVLDRVADAYAWFIRHSLPRSRVMGALGLVLVASAAIPARELHVDLRDLDIKADGLPIRVEVAGSRGYKVVGERVHVMEEALLAQRERLGIKNIGCQFHDWGGYCRAYPQHVVESEEEMEQFQDAIRLALPEQSSVTYRLGEREFHWTENRDRRVVDFALKGEDVDTLMALAEDVEAHLRKHIPKGDPRQPDAGGYDVVTSPFSEGAKELVVAPDADKLQRLGLTAQDVAQRISLAFQGIPMGEVRGTEGEMSMRMSVEGMSDDDDDEASDGPDLQALRELQLVAPNGTRIPLGTVASFRLVSAPSWVQRIDRQTEVRIQVRFFAADPEANRQQVDRAMESFAFPRGYSWGESTPWHQRSDSNHLIINLGLALLLVYAVMASLFESFLQPLAILVTCVLGGFGAPWALWATGTTTDITTMIGAFILVGIVVNNGIMLIDKVTQLRGAGLDREQALLQAGRDRLRPILMTATTTVLGLVPMLIHHPTLAGVYYHSIAIVIAGGLVTSTVVTLLFLPSVYVMIEDVSQAGRAWWHKLNP